MAFPAELSSTVASLHRHLETVEKTLANLLEENTLDKEESKDEEAAKEQCLERAQRDLATLFAINGLAWVWLRLQGTDPSSTSVKSEVDRVKTCMSRLKLAVEKKKRLGVDKAVAKRLVKGVLAGNSNKKKQKKWKN